MSLAGSINRQTRTGETAKAVTHVLPVGQRLLSLDFLRGVIMTVLILGETGVFQKLPVAFNNSFTRFLSAQFEHSKWRGLHIWDILLPAFMLMAGTSMAYSFKRQKEQPDYTWSRSFNKILKRSFWLLFWGVLIYSVRDNHLNFQLSNVLTQLAFTTLFSFFVINLKVEWQLIASVACLLIPELLYRSIHIPGFDEPFVKNRNAGAYIDSIILSNFDDNHGTNSINFIASTAHTIWGLMAGQLLLSGKRSYHKLSRIAIFGFIILVLGFALDLTNITPMLKWISTSSFVLATGGITLIILAICYEWIDIRKHQRGLMPFTVVGMNSIFIYLFFIFIGAKWLYGYANTLIVGLLNLLSVPFEVGAIISCLAVFAAEWYLCYFLYKKKLFFKL